MDRLVTWLWQGTVLAVGVWGVLRVWRPNASTRFAIWWATLAAVGALLVAPPLVSLPLSSMMSDVPASAPAPPPAGATAVVSGAPVDGASSDDAITLLPVTLPALPSTLVAIGIGAWLGLSILGLVHRRQRQPSASDQAGVPAVPVGARASLGAMAGGSRRGPARTALRVHGRALRVGARARLRAGDHCDQPLAGRRCR